MLQNLLEFILTILPSNYANALRINLYYNSFFNDPCSLYMIHLISFHNKVITYLVIIFTVMCIFLLGLFKPLILQHASKRSLYASVINNSIFIVPKVIVLWILYKIFSSICKHLSKKDNDFEFGLVSKLLISFVCKFFGLNIDKYNKETSGFFELRADVVKKVTRLNKDQVSFLIKDCAEWDLSIGDIEEYVLQQHAAQTTDITGMMRGYYWDRQKGLINSKFSNSDIKYLNKLTLVIDTITNDIKARLYVDKTWVKKYEHVFEAISFVHSKALEWFFFLIPFLTVVKILMPSVSLICETDTEAINPDLMVKVKGSQWYWSYEGQDKISSESFTTFQHLLGESTLNRLLGKFPPYGDLNDNYLNVFDELSYYMKPLADKSLALCDECNEFHDPIQSKARLYGYYGYEYENLENYLWKLSSIHGYPMYDETEEVYNFITNNTDLKDYFKSNKYELVYLFKAYLDFIYNELTANSHYDTYPNDELIIQRVVLIDELATLLYEMDKFQNSLSFFVAHWPELDYSTQDVVDYYDSLNQRNQYYYTEHLDPISYRSEALNNVLENILWEIRDDAVCKDCIDNAISNLSGGRLLKEYVSSPLLNLENEPNSFNINSANEMKSIMNRINSFLYNYDNFAIKRYEYATSCENNLLNYIVYKYSTYQLAEDKFFYLLDVYLDAALQSYKSIDQILIDTLTTGNSIIDDAPQLLMEKIKAELSAEAHLERDYIYDKLINKRVTYETIKKILDAYPLDNISNYMAFSLEDGEIKLPLSIQNILWLAMEHNNADIIYKALVIHNRQVGGDLDFNPYTKFGWMNFSKIFDNPPYEIKYKFDQNITPDSSSWSKYHHFDEIPLGDSFSEIVAQQINNTLFYGNIVPIRMSDKRLLTTTTALVLPVNSFIKFLISSTDVLHSWAVPSLGIKMDATPSRLNAVTSFITAPGHFTGQCSELCGPGHYEMPIYVHAVSYDEYMKYLELLKQKAKR